MQIVLEVPPELERQILGLLMGQRATDRPALVTSRPDPRLITRQVGNDPLTEDQMRPFAEGNRVWQKNFQRLMDHMALQPGALFTRREIAEVLKIDDRTVDSMFGQVSRLARTNGHPDQLPLRMDAVVDPSYNHPKWRRYVSPTDAVTWQMIRAASVKTARSA